MNPLQGVLVSIGVGFLVLALILWLIQLADQEASRS